MGTGLALAGTGLASGAGLAALSGCALLGTRITRGPYLQSGSDSGIVLRWRSSRPTDSLVRFGTTPDALTHAVHSAALTTEHQVALTGLKPDTLYHYAVGSSEAMPTGGDAAHHFITSPPAGIARPTRIWVIGDAGTGTAQQRAVRDAYLRFNGGGPTHLWLQLGDNAYDRGTDAEHQERVFDVYADLLRRSVTWPTLGNHDTADSTSPPDALPYFQIFSPPIDGRCGGVPSGQKLYYAFDAGDIHFVCLDSMVSSRQPGSPMLKWLEADLAANRCSWTVAFWHHPPYTKGAIDSDTETNATEMRRHVLPLLEQHGVDLVLGGHSHVYERSVLLDGHYGDSATLTDAMRLDAGSGRPQESGPYRKPAGRVPHAGTVYVVVGASGEPLKGPLNHPAMAVSASVAGSLVLDVDARRLEARCLTETGAVLDQFAIVKEPLPAAVGPG